MAITVEANYSKKLGLPQYSSHQYSVTVRTEISDLTQVEQESSRLYSLLQEAVDQEIRKEGWLPGEPSVPQSIKQTSQPTDPKDPGWKCSAPQRDLILKIVEENNLDRARIERMSTDRFGHGVKEVNRLEASALIDELFDICGQSRKQKSKHVSFRRGGNRQGGPTV
jgi:hypothetical protein